MNYLINESEVLKTWSPVIEKTTGITDRSKLNWMSKAVHYQHLHESAYNTAHVNPDMNLNGMGAVTLPGDPTTTTGFSAQAPGSGDKPYSLLPLAMQVAAQTIGLDLVPVVPMPGPLGILNYLDYHYGGGKLDSKEAPLVVKVPSTFISGTITEFTEGTTYFVNTDGTANGNVYAFTYLSDSRIDGYPVFKVVATDADGTLRRIGDAGTVTINTAVTNGSLYSAADGATEVAEFASVAELVKSLEDHIEGFAGRSIRLGDGATDKNEPYSRDEGESEVDNLMGLTLFNKSVEAKTYQVAAAVTREQVQDLKQFGIDAVSQIESVLINELTQSINKVILERIFRLGSTNHANSGVDNNLNFNTATTLTIGEGEDGNLVTMPAPTPKDPSYGGETKGDIQRRILAKILAAANIIAIRGRRGAGNFAVCSGQVSTALQNVAGFTPYPLSNTVNQNAGSLFPVGSIAGVNVYTDPNMNWDDTRVSVGRKGDGNSPGVVFMPYLMAESVQTIAEGTMAPKIAVKSRFAIVDAGHHPETMYLTFKINLGPDVPSLV